MQILRNIELSKYNTMRLHSVGDVMYIPTTEAELINVIHDLQGQNSSFHLLGAGSNIIFADRVHTPIINLMELDDSIKFDDNGMVIVGCSVRIQRLIRELQHNGFGGIEYLFSVPTSVGGAIYMNAGRGKSYNLSISDYVVSVEYLDLNDLIVKTLHKEANMFSYRHSPFQTMHTVVLRATFQFKQQDSTLTEQLIQERIEFSRCHLSADKPSCGSIFNQFNPRVMKFLMGCKKGEAMFSTKTLNWISNMGNATASDVNGLIKKAVNWHRWLMLPYHLEVRCFK